MNNENTNVTKTENEVKTYQYVYGVSFKKALQTYFFGYDNDSLNINDKVVVDTARGVELGIIKVAAKKANEVKLSTALKPIVRVASEADVKQYEKNIENASNAEKVFIDSVKEQKLDMYLVSAEYTLDATKVIFTYINNCHFTFPPSRIKVLRRT